MIKMKTSDHKDENVRPMCEICSKLTIKKLERRHWHHSFVFIVNFEQISTDNFEQIIVLVFSS